MAKKKSKILILGATGYIGKYVARASFLAGHPTWVLVRPATIATTDPLKKEILDNFKEWGLKVLPGDLNDHASMVAALKLVNVVISAVAAPQTRDQLKLIDAIKEVNKDKKKIKVRISSVIQSLAHRASKIS